MNLAIVVPCFNEEEVLGTTIGHLRELLNQLMAEGLVDPGSTITFIDDGSKDKTWNLIENVARCDSSMHGIKLSRNRGHQNALIAGLMTVSGDAIISVDADLQDDLSAIREMVIKYREGAEIVYGIRVDRRTDARFKRMSAEGYYWLLRLLGVDIVFNHADYRLMGHLAIEALKQYGEAS